MQEKPVSCGCLIRVKDKFLICRSTGSHIWGVPKGMMEKGETMLDAAIREVRGETGIDLSSKKSSLDFLIKYPAVCKTIVIFRIKLDKKIPVENLKCSETVNGKFPEIDKYAWVSKKNALELVKNHMRKIFMVA